MSRFTRKYLEFIDSDVLKNSKEEMKNLKSDADVIAYMINEIDNINSWHEFDNMFNTADLKEFETDIFSRCPKNLKAKPFFEVHNDLKDTLIGEFQMNSEQQARGVS